MKAGKAGTLRVVALTILLTPLILSAMCLAGPDEVVIKDLKRTMTLDPSSTRVLDDVHLTNYGADDVAYALISLPASAGTIKVYDTISFLNFDVVNETSSSKLIRVHLRFPLNTGVNTSFSLAYEVPSSFFLAEDDVVRIPLSSVLNQYPYTISSLNLIVITPEGTSSVTNTNPPPNNVEEGWRYRLTYKFNNLSAFSQDVLEFKVSFSPIALIPKPVLIAAATVSVLAVLFVARRTRRHARAETEVRKPALRLSDLATQIDTWIALQLELIKTADEYRAGKISKKEYNSRVESLKSDTRSLEAKIEDQLSKLSKGLKNWSQTFISIAKMLDELAADINRAEEAGKQYLSKQIPRSRYERIKSQAYSKASQVKSKISKKIGEIEDSLEK